MNALQTHFWAVRDYLAPVLRESKFKEHGRITPDEFVAAGDFLVYKFPTWSWSIGDSSKIRDFLPNDKQFLISRGVPCLRRVSQIERQAVGSASSSKDHNDASEKMINFQDGNERKGKGDEEDWLATHVDEPSSSGVGGIIDIPDSEPPLGASTMTSEEEDDLANRVADAKIAATSIDPLNSSNQEDREEIGDIPDIQDIPDMDDEDELGGGGDLIEEENDPANAAIKNNSTTKQEDAEEKSNSNLLSVRTYDCLITYDKYYQTPRMWLIGYNESGQTLKPKEIFQDISSDYAQKTVTIEPFPHTSGLNTASVHPCKHANVMKKVIERMDGTVRDEQRKAKLARGQNQNQPTTTSKEKEKEEKKKKGWTGGLGGAMKKVAGKETLSTSNSNPTTTSGSTSPNQGQEEEETEVEGLRVDQYMIIFLKFMASIVPAIEIDATQAV